MDLSTAIIERFAVPIVVTRFGPGSYDAEGKPVAGTTSTFTIMMTTIQPLTDAEMLSLPEGRRERRYVKGYTDTLLQISSQVNGFNADQLSYQGNNFEVQDVQTWVFPNTLNYWKVRLAQLNP